MSPSMNPLDWIAISAVCFGLLAASKIVDKLQQIHDALSSRPAAPPVQVAVPSVTIDIDAYTVQAIRNLTGAIDRLNKSIASR